MMIVYKIRRILQIIVFFLTTANEYAWQIEMNRHENGNEIQIADSIIRWSSVPNKIKKGIAHVPAIVFYYHKRFSFFFHFSPL